VTLGGASPGRRARKGAPAVLNPPNLDPADKALDVWRQSGTLAVSARTGREPPRLRLLPDSRLGPGREAEGPTRRGKIR
jgi:hypothetical protein